MSIEETIERFDKACEDIKETIETAGLSGSNTRVALTEVFYDLLKGCMEKGDANKLKSLMKKALTEYENRPVDHLKEQIRSQLMTIIRNTKV